MLTLKKPSLRLATLAVLLSLFASSAFAERFFGTNNQNRHDKEYRSDKKHQQHYKHEKHQKHQKYRDDRRYNNHHSYPHQSMNYSFHSNDRRLINDYYRDQQYKGQCPRGLVHRNNRCQPLRQAKVWHKGKPLASHIKYYELPNRLHGRLQPPPRDYRYVRVNNDILMVDQFNNIVVDAIENIWR